MSKKLQEAHISIAMIQNHVEPGEDDIGFLVIQGVFVNENINGKFDELTFMPAHKALTGMELSISALQEAGCSVKLFKPAKLEKCKCAKGVYRVKKNGDCGTCNKPF